MAGREQLVSIPAVMDVVHGLGVTQSRELKFATGHIPNPGGLIIADRSQPVPFGAELHSINVYALPHRLQGRNPETGIEGPRKGNGKPGNPVAVRARLQVVDRKAGPERG